MYNKLASKKILIFLFQNQQSKTLVGIWVKIWVMSDSNWRCSSVGKKDTMVLQWILLCMWENTRQSMHYVSRQEIVQSHVKKNLFTYLSSNPCCCTHMSWQRNTVVEYSHRLRFFYFDVCCLASRLLYKEI